MHPLKRISYGKDESSRRGSLPGGGISVRIHRNNEPKFYGRAIWAQFGQMTPFGLRHNWLPTGCTFRPRRLSTIFAGNLTWWGLRRFGKRCLPFSPRRRHPRTSRRVRSRSLRGTRTFFNAAIWAALFISKFRSLALPRNGEFCSGLATSSVSESINDLFSMFQGKDVSRPSEYRCHGEG